MSSTPPAAQPSATPAEASRLLAETVDKLADELVDLRRDLHAHPELSWHERRTTEVARERVAGAGWEITPTGATGFYADLGAGPGDPSDRGPVVALRADLDALPVDDTTGDAWASTTPGVAHACGHDVHTAALVGVAHALGEVHARGQLPGRVRLLFQPAEEVMPGGAHRLIGAGALDDVVAAFSLHCDPTVDVGQVGLREGALTGAADRVEVRLFGAGGHTSRPHLTQDLVFALGKVIAEVPAVLSRRLDPRAGVSLVWGMVSGGAAPNVIPSTGMVAGTLRMLDETAWDQAEGLVKEVVAGVLAPYGVTAEVDYERGVPPVVNERAATALLGDAARRVLGDDAVVPTAQSLGGEDFAWYLNRVPGSMGRLGTRTPGGPTYDLHRGDLRVDDRAVAIGAKILGEAALADCANRKVIQQLPATGQRSD